jgi:RNA polymerase sigma-70 factor (sigma-E family)
MRAADEQDYLDFATARAGALYRTACLLSTGDQHLAEDLVQETLGRMYVHWRRVATADNPVAYAHTVLVRVFLSHRHKRSTAEHPTGQLPEEVADDRDATLRVTLLGALAQLAPRDRAVLVLRYWEDRSIEETAQALRISAGAVRTQSSRALGRLRAVLGDSLPDLARS